MYINPKDLLFDNTPEERFSNRKNIMWNDGHRSYELIKDALKEIAGIEVRHEIDTKRLYLIKDGVEADLDEGGLRMLILWYSELHTMSAYEGTGKNKKLVEGKNISFSSKFSTEGYIRSGLCKSSVYNRGIEDLKRIYKEKSSDDVKDVKLEGALDKFFDVIPNPYNDEINEWASRHLYESFVARQLCEGLPIKISIALCGDAHAGKSEFFKRGFLSDDDFQKRHRSLRLDGIKNSHDPEKKLMEQLAGKDVVEVSELVKASTMGADEFKILFGESVVGSREAFGKASHDLLFSFLLGATFNPDDHRPALPNDDTAADRLLVIRVAEIKDRIADVSEMYRDHFKRLALNSLINYLDKELNDGVTDDKLKWKPLAERGFKGFTDPRVMKALQRRLTEIPRRLANAQRRTNAQHQYEKNRELKTRFEEVFLHKFFASAEDDPMTYSSLHDWGMRKNAPTWFGQWHLRKKFNEELSDSGKISEHDFVDLLASFGFAFKKDFRCVNSKQGINMPLSSWQLPVDIAYQFDAIYPNSEDKVMANLKRVKDDLKKEHLSKNKIINTLKNTFRVRGEFWGHEFVRVLQADGLLNDLQLKEIDSLFGEEYQGVESDDAKGDEDTCAIEKAAEELIEDVERQSPKDHEAEQQSSENHEDEQDGEQNDDDDNMFEELPF